MDLAFNQSFKALVLLTLITSVIIFSRTLRTRNFHYCLFMMQLETTHFYLICRTHNIKVYKT